MMAADDSSAPGNEARHVSEVASGVRSQPGRAIRIAATADPDSVIDSQVGFGYHERECCSVAGCGPSLRGFFAVTTSAVRSPGHSVQNDPLPDLVVRERAAVNPSQQLRRRRYQAELRK
jgi:hypothetical protein